MVSFMSVLGDRDKLIGREVRAVSADGKEYHGTVLGFNPGYESEHDYDSIDIDTGEKGIIRCFFEDDLSELVLSN